MDCPKCNGAMDDGFLYVRGISTSLSWSARGEIPFYSRKEIDQIHLGMISSTPTGAQAVIPAYQCPECGLTAFNSR